MPNDRPAGGKKPSRPRMSLTETMTELEAAGSAQTRKTYGRHGVTEPMFGVSFATLQVLRKRIGVDHELAVGLWETGNYDARNLALKIVDPLQMGPDELERWATGASAGTLCADYAATLSGEGPHGRAMAEAWLASSDLRHRRAGWPLVGFLSQHDEGLPDAWFVGHLEEIERTIHQASNSERAAMNLALIQIGCRNEALRERGLAAADRVGVVHVDQGDTACETPVARRSIEKAWAFAATKGFASPAAQERKRELLRRRC